jgi:DNA-binding GntR family transcriptional regulator
VAPLSNRRLPEDWLQALSPPRRGTAAVAWELRQRIRRNQLPSGRRLRLIEIMNEWGLSAAEARSAMALLGRLGVVRQQPGGGAVVYRPTRIQIEESWRVRSALEALAAEAAARRIERPQVDLLEAMLKEMRGMRPRQQLRYILVLDPAFHDVINGASGMRRLQRLVAQARVAADIGMVLVTTEEVSGRPEIDKAHQVILEALAAHDPKAASDAVRRHYEVRRAYWLDSWDQGTRDEIKIDRLRAAQRVERLD